MQHGDIIEIQHPSQHYRTVFSRNSGFFIRKEEIGYPEPFWAADGPELLDISITNYCEHGCSFCYRQSNSQGKHIKLEDLTEIVRQASQTGVLQIALGGGNPNQHPQFIKILHLIRDHDIIPSYTSNGEGLTPEILLATKETCGAMAISLYPPYDKYPELVSRISDYGIKLNLHVILKIDTINQITDWLNTPPTWFEKVNALIVLNYKPIANVRDQSVVDKKQLSQFYDAVSKCQAVKIGFDSCCVPGIVTWMNVDPILIESCEAARFSAFISEDLKMFPCSFMANTMSYGDLKQEKLIDVWRFHPAFVKHRQLIQNNTCVSCRFRAVCNGGCVFLPTINQCRLLNK